MWSFLLRNQERFRRRLRGAWLHRLIGERLFRDHLWVHTQRAVAGGLALGLFIAMTPTIPLQMILAMFGAIYFRLNLPIAVGACWVTNPLTVVPVYFLSWRLGRFVLEEVFIVEDFFDLFAKHGQLNAFVKQSAYLWTGSLILAFLAALAGYGVAWVAWGFFAKAIEHRRAGRL